MKQYKKLLIFTTLATLLPIPVHFFLGRDGIFPVFVPLMMAAAQVLCVFITCKDPRNSSQHRKPMTVVMWIMPVMTNVMCYLDMALALGLDFSFTLIFNFLFGLMFMFIGNYLPKVKMNSTLGIKIYWAYTSEENWNATHRFGGKVWFWGGFVILLSCLLPENWGFGVMMVSIFALSIIPLVYSWRYYNMQKARGDVLKPVIQPSTRAGKWAIIFTAATLVFVGVMMFTGDIEYRFEDTYFTAEASHYDDLIVHYDAIESMELLESHVPSTRRWGYGSARLLMGTFESPELGLFTRYTYTEPGLCILMKVSGKPYVLSAKSPEATKALYEELMSRVDN